jgi:outer membrane protein assembly factor BamD
LLLAGLATNLAGCGSPKQDLYKNKTVTEIYAMGQKNIKDGKYANAIKDYEALEARFPYGEYADKSQLAIIYAHYKKGEMEQAMAAADRFIRLHPHHPHVDYAYYMQGIANYNDNFTMVYRRLPLDRSKREPTQAKKSFNVFKLLVDKFPNSKYAPDARQRMIFLKNQLAGHELFVANYYLARGAYLAAANRAGFVITNFDKSAAVPDALEILYAAYTGLGRTKLANDVLHTMQTNYPDRKIGN